MSNKDAGAPPVTGGAQAIRRAVEILCAVAQLQRSGASLSRVARATGLNTSTAFRILRSLAEERLLKYDESERHYYVGTLAFELGLAASTNIYREIEARWRSAIESVARKTRLTTYLMMRSHDEAICLGCIEGSAVLRAMPVDTGQRLPLGLGAGSLAILATLDDEEIQRILTAQSLRLAQMGGGRNTTEEILQRVAMAKKRGFSSSSGTITPGIAGVGVAIATPLDQTPLAISVSAVAKEFSPQEAQEIANTINAAIRECRNQQGPVQ